MEASLNVCIAAVASVKYSDKTLLKSHHHELLACLTMSNLPTKFHSCGLIRSGCSYLGKYSCDDECKANVSNTLMYKHIRLSYAIPHILREMHK